jgi:hypothetical protein
VGVQWRQVGTLDLLVVDKLRILIDHLRIRPLQLFGPRGAISVPIPGGIELRLRRLRPPSIDVKLRQCAGIFGDAARDLAA